MHDPGGEQLCERDGTEGGVDALESQFTCAQVPTTQDAQILGAERHERVQQLRHGLARTFLPMREAVEWGEPAIRTRREDDARPHDPVCALAVDQVPEVVDRREGVRSFVRVEPLLRQVGQEGAERTRSPFEDGDRVRQVERVQGNGDG